ncbi:MAG TPA: hypothetical protein PLO88_04080, partial [Bacilli bacterium]|nr:hypothetical protein [Bacilli bacterium]
VIYSEPTKLSTEGVLTSKEAEEKRKQALIQQQIEDKVCMDEKIEYFRFLPEIPEAIIKKYKLSLDKKDEKGATYLSDPQQKYAFVKVVVYNKRTSVLLEVRKHLPEDAKSLNTARALFEEMKVELKEAEAVAKQNSPQGRLAALFDKLHAEGNTTRIHLSIIFKGDPKPVVGHVFRNKDGQYGLIRGRYKVNGERIDVEDIVDFKTI